MLKQRKSAVTSRMERWVGKLPKWEKCVCAEGKHSVGVEEAKTVR